MLQYVTSREMYVSSRVLQMLCMMLSGCVWGSCCFMCWCCVFKICVSTSVTWFLCERCKRVAAHLGVARAESFSVCESWYFDITNDKNNRNQWNVATFNVNKYWIYLLLQSRCTILWEIYYNNNNNNNLWNERLFNWWSHSVSCSW